MNQADAALTHLSPRSLRCRFGGGDRPNGEAASVEDVDSWSGVSGRGRSSVVVVESVRCRLCRDSEEAEVDSCGGSFVSDIEFADYCLSRERERASTGARASSKTRRGKRSERGTAESALAEVDSHVQPIQPAAPNHPDRPPMMHFYSSHLFLVRKSHRIGQNVQFWPYKRV